MSEESAETGSTWRQTLAVINAAPDADSWVIIDQMIGTSVYRTHYFCRACCADLSDLRVHHVACCPYCMVPLSFLLDGQERARIQWAGEWPYDALRSRFVEWCSWMGIRDGDLGEQLPNGGQSWVMHRCRLIDGHRGDHRYDEGPRQIPPRNPLREWFSMNGERA